MENYKNEKIETFFLQGTSFTEMEEKTADILLEMEIKTI